MVWGRISGKGKDGKSRFLSRVGLKRFLMIFSIVMMGSLVLCNFTEDISYNTIRSVYKSIVDRGEIEILYDEHGVPYVDYCHDDGIFIGRQRNPVTISQKGLEYLKNYKNGDEGSLQPLESCARWILENSKEMEGFSLLEYNFPWPKYNMTSPWRSAMAQGQAIQFLVNVHEHTQKEEYLNCARDLLNAFFFEISQGGVTIKFEEEGWWYEEYAHENGVRSMVLNGMMFALLGIYEYYRYTNEKDAQSLFDQGILALKSRLPEFDNNGDSNYDVLGTPSGTYHETHVRLLFIFYELTGNGIFLEYHKRWKSFEDNLFLVKLISNPLPMRWVILLVNFIVLLFFLKTITLVRLNIKRIGRIVGKRNQRHLGQRIVNSLIYVNKSFR